MLVVGTQSQIEEYKNSENLNQSTIKKLLEGIDNRDTEVDPTKPHIIMGSAVDSLLLGEEGDFDNIYYIGENTKKPTESVLKVLEQVHSLCIQDYEEYLATVVTVNSPTIFEGGSEITVVQDSIEEEVVPTSFAEFVGSYSEKDDYILSSAEFTGYNPKWGPEAKLKALKTDDAIEYFKGLCLGHGKIVIDRTTYDNIKTIIISLKTNFRTRKYFDRETLEDDNNITCYYQLPIFFTYDYEGVSVPCKALLDMVIVIKNREGVIDAVIPIDLKTMSGNTVNFISSLKARRYDIQAAWYTEALIQHFKVDPAIVQQFQFVVESTTSPGKPLVFVCSEELMQIGKQGRRAVSVVDTSNVFGGYSTAIIQREIKGIEQLMDMYVWHSQNGWEEEREVRTSNGPIELNWDGIVQNLL